MAFWTRKRIDLDLVAALNGEELFEGTHRPKPFDGQLRHLDEYLVNTIKAKIERSRNECINHTCAKRERLCGRHRGMTEILLVVQQSQAPLTSIDDERLRSIQ